MTFSIPLDLILRFFLIFFRLSGLFSSAPLFSSRSVPVRIKLFSSLVLSLIFLPLFKTHIPASLDTLFLLVLFIKEFGIGVLMGFWGRILFAAFEMAGVFMGFQIGFGIANLLDPFTSEHISLLSQLENIVAVLIFLSLDGHHLFVKAMYKSFIYFPPFSFHISGNIVEALLRKSADMFIISFQLWLPVMIVVLLSHISLGFMAKTAPQLNIFVIGLPLQIFLGLIVLLLTLPLASCLFSKHFASLGEVLYWFSRGAH